MKRFLLSILIFGAAFLAVNLLYEHLVEVDNPWYTRKVELKALKWKEIRDGSNDFNTVILGSSRGFLAYDPHVIDSVAGSRSYNVCSGSQNIVESYYSLQEILETRKIDTVIYEMFIPSFSANPDYLNVTTSADQFTSSSRKWEMMCYGYGIEGLVNMSFSMVRDRPYIKTAVLGTIFRTRKNESASPPLEIVNGHNRVRTIVSDDAIAEFTPIFDFGNTATSERMLDFWFPKFAQLCRDNDIELICIRAPYPPSRMKLSETDEAHGYFKEKCKTQNLLFIDLGYDASGNLDSRYTDQDFYDYHHMNLAGAAKASAHLGSELKKLK